MVTNSFGFAEHPLRSGVLGELHARPFLPLKLPRRIYHFAFMTDDRQAHDDRQEILALAAKRGSAPPADDAKFHHFDFGPWDLRWEQHAEFTTYTWATSRDAEEPFAKPNPIAEGEVNFRGPGELISAVHMSCVARDRLIENLGERFHPESLCVIEAAEKCARVTTDFQVDPAGFSRILVEANKVTGLTATRAGRLCQRLLEIETYRTLSLLGLPVARTVRADLDRMELELASITAEIAQVGDHPESQDMLRRLGRVAAELEAQAARTAYRFSATRAYYGIINSRLETIREEQSGQFPTVSAFFNRRLRPAIETCNAAEGRQERLSGQLARATELLSTGIQADLEKQNRDLLHSMNDRARMQLRLQQTVEGLSVAAISYYVVGLVGYVAKGLKDVGVLPKDVGVGMIMGIAVPAVLLLVWLALREIHRRVHGADGDEKH
ncbi:MAG: DUF3422 domain-containing protein [Alphaproteobacteria bacterium]|nr:DUF3422 domain-containing protein [Alphaproteobacteria bacterium]